MKGVVLCHQAEVAFEAVRLHLGYSLRCQEVH